MRLFQFHAGQRYQADSLRQHLAHGVPVGGFTDNQNTGLGKIHDVLCGRRRQRGKHTHRDVARTDDREIGKEPVCTVARQQRDALPAAEVMLKHRRHRIDGRGRLAPGDIPGALGQQVLEPDRVRRFPSPVGKELVECIGLHGEILSLILYVQCTKPGEGYQQIRAQRSSSACWPVPVGVARWATPPCPISGR